MNINKTATLQQSLNKQNTYENLLLRFKTTNNNKKYGAVTLKTNRNVHHK